MSEIGEKIKGYIVESFLFGAETDLSESTSFLDEGIIDSTGVLELVEFLETSFELTVEDEELLPENLDSISRIETFIKSKKSLSTKKPDIQKVL